MGRRLAMAMMGAALLLSATARADEGPVRIQLESGEELAGTLLEFREGVFRVVVDGRERQVPEHEVLRLVFEAAPQSPARLEVEPLASGGLRLSLAEADVRAAILSIARAGQLNLTLAPEVRGRASLELADVAPLQALRLVVESAGDYLVLHEPAFRHVRIQARSACEQEWSLRAYPLVERDPSRAVLLRRESLLSTVRDLLVSSGVAGAGAAYDSVRQVMFVATWPPGLADVERILADELKPQPELPGERGDVRGEFLGVDLREALLEVARGEPLLLGPEVRGQVTAHYLGLPPGYALRQLALACGYGVVSDAVATRVQARGVIEQQLELRTLPLTLPRAEFWNLPYLHRTRDVVGWPPHPLERVLDELTTATGIAGGCAVLDAGAHRVFLQLPASAQAAFRQALVAAGYLQPLPLEAPGSPRELSDEDLRAALQRVAQARGVNLVLGSEVRGSLRGSYRADAAPGAILRALARTGGDYAVTEPSPGTFRVASRSSLAQVVETVRLPLRERGSASATRLSWALEQLVTATGIAGAMSAHEPEGNFIALALPRPELDDFRALVRGADLPSPAEERVELTLSSQGQRGDVWVRPHVLGSAGLMGERLMVNPKRPTCAAEFGGWSLELSLDTEQSLLHLVARRGDEEQRLTRVVPPRR